MKKKMACLIIISILVCVGNVEEVSAQAEIQSTVTDILGIKQKLTIDSVKQVGTKLDEYNYPCEYAQVVDGHYYYMRQIKSNRYTIYRDAGKKVGSFNVKSLGVKDFWCAFGWHEGKFYLEILNDHDHTIKIAVVDFKQETIKTVCTCTIVHPIEDRDFLQKMKVYLYQNKIYVMVEREIEEFDMPSGNLLNKYSFPKPGKKETLDFINIADGKIYYVMERLKGKKQIVTFRCRDMATNKDKKVFRCNVSGSDLYCHSLIMKGKEIYYYRTYGEYADRHVLAYSIPSAGGKMKQIGKGVIRDFSYNSKYFFYIDKKYRLHRQNRKTGKDKVISGIKAVKVDCTQRGLYVQKYDKWFVNDGYFYAYEDYAYALYFMNYKGGNVKRIAKYTKGHIEV